MEKSKQCLLAGRERRRLGAFLRIQAAEVRSGADLWTRGCVSRRFRSAARYAAWSGNVPRRFGAAAAYALCV